MSLVSVIIPNYQCEKWLPVTLDSCLQQKEYIKEIIVVDDFSTDGSWNVLTEYQAKYPDLVKIFRNKEKGGNNARNYGYDQSTGDYIQWLDADDQLLPNKLAKQLEVFNKVTDTDIVYSDWQLNTYNDSGQVVHQEFKQHRQYEDFLFELLLNNWSAPNNYLIKRAMADTLSKLNAWNLATPVLQDREYFTLAAIAGARFEYAAGNFSVYNRWSKQSVSNNHGKRSVALQTLLNGFWKKIECNSELDHQRKRTYLQIITTDKLIDMMSGKKVLVRDKDLKFRNIYWPMVKNKSTKIKLFIALMLNIV
jgi:glycosyltransferase involved in cell wall biosynthesis